MEEEEGDGGIHWECGINRLGGDPRKEEACGDDGGLMLFIFHQFGLPAIIC